MNETRVPKEEEINRDWHLVDAAGKRLGRLASEIAHILRGKHKPIFTPHLDCGDYVVVINARQVELTGNKVDQKKYYYHTGYPGGIKEIPYHRLLEKKPEFVIQKAVRGMLPKNRLGKRMLKKLKIYADAEHPHQAQSPQTLDL